MPYLRDVRMSNNTFSDCIPTSFFFLLNLEILYLDKNELSCELFSAIYAGPALKDLQMQDNKFYGSIPSITTTSSLMYLNLGNNDLASTLPSELSNLPNIKYLDISNNKIKGPIPTQIGSLTQLESIDFEGNALSGTIPNELGNLNQITLLLLERNKLAGSMPNQVCEIQSANSASITADCYGEYPLVSCACCSNCEPERIS